MDKLLSYSNQKFETFLQKVFRFKKENKQNKEVETKIIKESIIKSDYHLGKFLNWHYAQCHSLIGNGAKVSNRLWNYQVNKKPGFSHDGNYKNTRGVSGSLFSQQREFLSFITINNVCPFSKISNGYWLWVKS